MIQKCIYFFFFLFDIYTEIISKLTIQIQICYFNIKLLLMQAYHQYGVGSRPAL